MRLTQFGTVTLPEHNGQDRLPLSIRNNFTELQNGGIDLDGNNVVVNPIALTRSAVIVDSIQSNLRAILKEAGKGRLLLRAKDFDNTQLQTFSKVIRIDPDIDARKYGCEQALEINFMQDYPFWMLSSEEPTYLDDGEVLDEYAAWNLDGGNYDSLTITSPTVIDSVTIDNTGGSVVYKGYFVISATGTNVEIGNIIITNVTNGLKITYTGGLGDGTGSSEGDIYIDWLAKTTLDDTSTQDYSLLTLPSGQSDYFRLELGENVITASFESLSGTNNLNIDIYWSKHYLF